VGKKTEKVAGPSRGKENSRALNGNENTKRFRKVGKNCIAGKRLGIRRDSKSQGVVCKRRSQYSGGTKNINAHV